MLCGARVVQALSGVVARAQLAALLNTKATHGAPEALTVHGIEVGRLPWAIAQAEVELLDGPLPNGCGGSGALA